MPVDPRTAAHALAQIAAYLELHGENRFKAKAYDSAAKALKGFVSDDLAGPLESGELAAVRGLGPATLAVVRDLVEHGQSRYLEQLRQTTPEGLLDMLRVPGLTAARVHAIHEGLGVETIDALELAARDGRLEKLPRYGKKTAEKILAGIALYRSRGTTRLYHHARVEGERLRAIVAAHPDVVRATIGGPLRRHCETIGTIDIVASCRAAPDAVAAALTRIGGVERATGAGSSVEIQFVDGMTMRLHCARERDFGMALVVATGTTEHVTNVARRLVERGFSIGSHGLEQRGQAVATLDEETVYRHAGLQWVDPALREDRGEIDAAARQALPTLISDGDVRGILHCHTVYSDGRATIAEMATAAAEHGWEYLGVSDHSEAAFYAQGLTAPQLRAQMAEIDDFNLVHSGVRLLKGIEAEILADGRLDYGAEVLDRFDYVIGAVHSRYAMNRQEMTERVLRAFDDPHLTILAHPTGRLLLSREPSTLDVDLMLEKAAEKGVAVELNADPKRLDLDWRYLRRAKEIGTRIAIGPDAHSVNGLDNVFVGVGLARKGWLEAGDVLNTGSAEAVLEFARARRRA